MVKSVREKTRRKESRQMAVLRGRGSVKDRPSGRKHARAPSSRGCSHDLARPRIWVRIRPPTPPAERPPQVPADADRTNELPAAKKTLTDLDPDGTGELSVHDFITVHELPLADKSTIELGTEDFLEEELDPFAHKPLLRRFMPPEAHAPPAKPAVPKGPPPPAKMEISVRDVVVEDDSGPRIPTAPETFPPRCTDLPGEDPPSPDKTQPFRRADVLGEVPPPVSANTHLDSLGGLRPNLRPTREVDESRFPKPLPNTSTTPHQPFALVNPARAETAPANSTRPTSIAPIAMDVRSSRPDTHAQPPQRRADRTTRLPRVTAAQATAKTRKASPAWIFAAAAIVVAAVGAPLAFVAGRADTASVRVVSPKTANVTAARRVVIATTPELAPQKAALLHLGGDGTDTPTVDPNSLPSVAPNAAPPPFSHGMGSSPAAMNAPATANHGGTTSKASKVTANTATQKPVDPPPPATTVAAAAAPPPPPSRPPGPVAMTGVVIVSGSVMTIVIDGEHRRVHDGKIVVSCGKHKIRAGFSGTQRIDVPCGGAVSL